MRKSLVVLLAVCICFAASPSFSDTPTFSFTFPRPHQSTLSDWTTASAIVQAIQRPNIPAKDYSVDFSGGDARKAIQDAIDKPAPKAAEESSFLQENISAREQSPSRAA